MPAPSDILQFMKGQLFQTPILPNIDLTGRTFIVTGANSGLGLECANHLVGLGVSDLILACRSLAKGEAAKGDILKGNPSSKSAIQVWKIDMASYQSVVDFSKRMHKDLPRLDAVLINAGISTRDFILAEGVESTLTVNVVSAFLLGLLVLPQLQSSAEKIGGPTHLTITGSVVHCFAAQQQLQSPQAGMIFETLNDPSKADMGGRYFLSKLIVMQCVQELAKRMRQKDEFGQVIVNCPNPGWCKTPLFRSDDGGIFARNLLRIIGRTAEMGSRTLVHAVTAKEETHGHYLSECQVKPTSAFVRSSEGIMVQIKVWNELVELLENIHSGVSDVLQ